MRISLVIVSTLLGFGSPSGNVTAAERTEVKSSFQISPCAVAVMPDERIECGTLTVPENRAKAASRAIKLPVIIFRSNASAPAPDPVVFLPGGPGLSSIEGRTTGKGNPFLKDRDQILLEGRGNRLAQPSLACPEITALRAANGSSAKQVAAVARCRAAHVASGTDLDGYTSAESAADLDDLRRLLGIKQWNLIGFSYGTRLAQTVLALYPEGVRSVVLDSVLPIDINYDEMGGTALRRSINLLFDGCASDPVCDARNPALRTRFARLVDLADRDGIVVRDRTLRGSDLVEAIAEGMQHPAMMGSLPGMISEASKGKFDQWLPLLTVTPSNYNWGLRLSIWCGEEMPFEQPARIAAQSAPALGLGGIDASTASPEMCAAWNVAAAPPQSNVAVKSEVPTLILAGQFDPVTPPAWGRRLLRTMPNARFVEVPGQSHGAMFNRCGGQLALAFLRDPRAPLDLDCVAKMEGLAFPRD